MSFGALILPTVLSQKIKLASFTLYNENINEYVFSNYQQLFLWLPHVEIYVTTYNKI